MNRNIHYIAGCLLLGLALASSCVRGEDFGNDYIAALKAHKADNKPLVVAIGADY